MAIYYCSTTGDDDTGDGSIGNPWYSWDKQPVGGLLAGDIVYIRGGTYRSTKVYSWKADDDTFDWTYRWNGLSGTDINRIRILAYPDEYPILNIDDIIPAYHTSFLRIRNCTYLDIKGLRVTGGVEQETPFVTILYGISLYNSDYITVENCTVDHTEGWGFYCFTSNNNIFLNCDAYALADTHFGNGGANGFNITGGDTSDYITYRGCRAWFCSDDGFDLYDNNGSHVTFENCWAFWNGYDESFNHIGDGNGFKLGPSYSEHYLDHLKTLTCCLSVENYSMGYSENSSDYSSLMWLYNCVSYGNGSWNWLNFNLPNEPAHVFRNNLFYPGGIEGSTEIYDDTYNSWNGGVTVTNADFVSTDSTQLIGARQANGDLPVMTFLHLATSSDLIGAGTDVGLLTDGEGKPYLNPPSIGAYEYGSSTLQTIISKPNIHGWHTP